jgi:predicted DNA-binding protein (UPF0251 family)
MPRPRKFRRVCCKPSVYYFKPRGIPVYELEEIIIDHDELESLRLADLLCYSHEDAASEMKISRATFGRILESARKKVIDGILNGKAIRINDKQLTKIKNNEQQNKNSNCNRRPGKCHRSYRKM